MSPTEIDVVADHDALAELIADRLIAHLVAAQADGGFPNIALTGGRIGTACLARLGASPHRDSIDWSRVGVWWGDERYVPAESADRNDVGAMDALLSHVSIPATNIHRMPSTDDGFATVEDAAESYANALTLDDFALDLVLLGIGPDGHVASLFPEQPAVHDTRACVAVHGSPKPPPTRITLTFPVIQAAREVWILASGSEKADALLLALSEDVGAFQVPAAGARGTLRTLVLADEAAAEKLGDVTRS